ncbi:hypothetical protein [Achromobacter xylosoxidans]|uniref:Uncharacterized protein n=1 Tax=Alcaligenes xylosoxydans xylosoxydans TaxID=85698 RepID=A0A1R1JUI6_ALCXX|nr:hypothetical protein [Achromobacter xylosoxidans]OMG87978.1 hypothetical protein BIZ92_10295 [Achromobacter xylosoxidans]
MTTNTPAPAQEAVLTADQEIDAIMEQAQVFASAWAFLGGPFDNGSGLETAEREKANLRALLSKLRAPVADERDRNATISEVVGLCNRIPGATTWNAAQFMYDEMHRRAALASAPVASAEVTAALDWLDDFVARCNGDDRGVCESVNLLRRALASAPVAGEAQPDRQAVLEAIHRYGNARAMAEHNIAYRDEVRSTYDALVALFDVAPLASEAVRDADHPVFAFLLGEGPLRGVHFGDRHPDERGAYWWRKDLSAALSAHPGARKNGGSDA